MNPIPRLRRLRRLAALAIPLLAAALAPSSAAAVKLGAVRVTRVEDHATVELAMTGVLSPPVRESLERGMPATVRLSVELWRARPGWFDEMVRTERAEMRIARNAWSDEFQMRRQAGPLLTLLDLDETERELERPIRVRVLPLARLRQDARYYAIARVEVKPLTVEDIEEVEDWLSGEAKRTGKPGPGSIARLPTFMMGLLANLSGHGDETAAVRTGAFTRRNLER
ncbi:MAG: DUF4390 domain-containing protein [Candidatus Eisenbacteria bacterium]